MRIFASICLAIFVLFVARSAFETSRSLYGVGRYSLKVRRQTFEEHEVMSDAERALMAFESSSRIGFQFRTFESLPNIVTCCDSSSRTARLFVNSLSNHVEGTLLIPRG